MLKEKLINKDGFTDTEKQIADFLLGKGEEAAYMTVRQLADDCYASQTVVMRFCKKLGYKGFNDFKVAFVKELENVRFNDEVDVNRPFYLDYSSRKIAQTIFSLNRQALIACMNELDYSQLEKAARWITRSRITFLYGYGDSSIRARNLMNRLFKINKMCILATESHEEAGISINATNQDVAVFISYRGGNETFNTCADLLQKNKCPVVLLSANVESQLAKKADCWITIPDMEHAADNIGTFYSQVAFDYVLNVLYSLVYSNRYTDSHKHKKQIDEFATL